MKKRELEQKMVDIDNLNPEQKELLKRMSQIQCPTEELDKHRIREAEMLEKKALRKFNKMTHYEKLTSGELIRR